ncbi:hypothetical protein E2562_013363 [Oryza meyeriana var. granulata]|uniref:Uncharacterized protein n=1 Tax=Oryza meyeriana var. granulata TaxID=110450 RepID=A0A6G1CG30_9ORYZ|nr:hypothetical protein E2562_013363 [Oryza meyeriana var. granulata]KAF0899135.1 hypothetical protein E2562_013363 [Oryza meyeriana var. granulata]
MFNSVKGLLEQETSSKIHASAMTTSKNLAMILIYGSPWKGTYLMLRILNVLVLKMETLASSMICSTFLFKFHEKRWWKCGCWMDCYTITLCTTIRYLRRQVFNATDVY